MKPNGFLVSNQVLLITALKDKFHTVEKINVYNRWPEVKIIGNFFLVLEWRNSKHIHILML